MTNASISKQHAALKAADNEKYPHRYWMERYLNDVGFLLREIKKHKANEDQFIEICTDQNARIEQLKLIIKQEYHA